ncbi:hypothetical protein FA95DRAFT_1568161 [Auriscalpium vulgare]|uniref:Uncharacterized protein n=1 Tax=Auriscalpium vulgare TaxID=40419 RepID=A0ACB8R0B0_9AGAM|nr:hypothetical protein FA95DRAFT_1568161 [Auriscalpium vulgare]
MASLGERVLNERCAVVVLSSPLVMSSEQLGLPSALDCDSVSGPHRYQVLACSTAPPTLRRAGARRLVRSRRRLPLEQLLGLLSSDMTSVTFRMLCDVQLTTGLLLSTSAAALCLFARCPRCT